MVNNHHGVYDSVKRVRLGNLVCDNCHHHMAFCRSKVLLCYLKCEHD
ncbi:MAG: zinc ribbon-containing protein [Candidatus Malihini olakiniferum]